jgi:hypothetical protein
MRLSATGILPRPAREELQRAAMTPIPKNDPLARARAINETIERLRAMYPDYFKQEVETC